MKRSNERHASWSCSYTAKRLRGWAWASRRGKAGPLWHFIGRGESGSTDTCGHVVGREDLRAVLPRPRATRAVTISPTLWPLRTSNFPSVFYSHQRVLVVTETVGEHKRREKKNRYERDARLAGGWSGQWLRRDNSLTAARVPALPWRTAKTSMLCPRFVTLIAAVASASALARPLDWHQSGELQGNVVSAAAFSRAAACRCGPDRPPVVTRHLTHRPG
ncbi:hypothetical protein B0T16DRAFT_418885 [Cercophora newfieldiana]|uniref:Uncharacterized protein n=1 Tax=Cercophora newfieldiana TaxID=92897 RepID=A0AA40CJR3_9PEZI|nr:hypothetical protein B0T16DRAFT_418885 [Cercophora newfieldiana]